jgi:hypothetical protein
MKAQSPPRPAPAKSAEAPPLLELEERESK